MANEIIRPTQLPARADPVASEVVPSDNGSAVAGVTWQDGVNAAVPVASQPEAEAGVNNSKRMTPLTTKQAIDAQVDPKISSAIGALNLGSASQSQVEDFATAIQGAKADSAVQPSRTVSTGAGLTGGGSLAADQTIALNSASIASLAKADTSVQTVNGNSPDGSGDVVVDAEFTQEQDSRASAMLATFAPTVEWVRTAGYSSAGDGGGALYKRALSEPSHAGKFQSADGAWWELTELDISCLVFGVFPGGSSSVSSGLQDALDYLRVKGGGRLRVPSGVYLSDTTLRIGSYTTLEMQGDATIRRSANTDCMIISYSDGIVGGFDAASDISIMGGTWDHNATNFADPGSAIAFGHCTRPTVRGATVLDVSGRYHAIECNSSNQVTIEDCVFDGGGNDELAGECIQIDGAYAGGAFPWYGPYDNTPCSDIAIRRNRFTNWATNIGSHTAVGAGRHENIKIYENYFSFSRAGIVMFNWAGVTIRDNRFAGLMPGVGGQQYGIHSTYSGNDCSDVLIEGNTFLNLLRDTSPSAGSRGINIAGDQSASNGLRNLRILNNYLQDIGRHAIAIENCLGLMVCRNRIAGPGGRGIYSYGNNQTVIDGNHITSSHTDPAITVMAVGTFAGTSQIVTGNLVSGSNGGIVASTNWLVLVNNITPALTKTGATGILGPNWVNGVIVA